MKNRWVRTLISLMVAVMLTFPLANRLAMLIELATALKLTTFLLLFTNGFLLWYVFIHPWLAAMLAAKRKKMGMLACLAAIITALVMIFPYRSIPIRTTHTLEIIPASNRVNLQEVTTSQSGLIYPEEWQWNGNVHPQGGTGILLEPGSSIRLQRKMTGGITLRFSEESGQMLIIWDGTETNFTPGSMNNFSFTTDGSRWGSPDLIWKAYGMAAVFSEGVLLFLFFWLAASWASLNLSEKGIKACWQGLHHSTVAQLWLGFLLFAAIGGWFYRAGLPFYLPYGYLLCFVLPAIILLTAQLFSHFSQNPFIEKTRGFFKQLGNLNQKMWLFVCLCLPVILCLAVLYLNYTTQGMGASGDSVHYMDAAANLAAGNGYTYHIVNAEPQTLTHFPPLYSLLLSVPVMLGAAPMLAARWFNLLALSASLVLVGFIILRTTRSVLSAIFGVLILLASISIFNTFTWVMSEVIFIPMVLLCLYFLVAYLDKQKIWQLGLSTLFASLALFSRLAGVVMIGVVGLCLLMFLPQKFGKRLLMAVCAGLIAFIPIGLFALRNVLAVGVKVGSVGFESDAVALKYSEIIRNSLFGWVFPQPLMENVPITTPFAHISVQDAAFWGLISLLAIGLLVSLLIKPTTPTASHPSRMTWFKVLPVFLVLYTILFIVTLITQSEVTTAYGAQRYLIPFLVAFVPWAVMVYHRAGWGGTNNHLMRLIAVMLALMLLAIQIPSFLAYVQKPPQYALMYTDIKNKCEQRAALIDQLPDRQDYYTNNCELVYFLTGIPCQHLPADAASRQPGSDFDQAMQNGAVVVYVAGSGFKVEASASLLSQMELYYSDCALDFYRLPVE